MYTLKGERKQTKKVRENRKTRGRKDTLFVSGTYL